MLPAGRAVVAVKSLKEQLLSLRRTSGITGSCPLKRGPVNPVKLQAEMPFGLELPPGTEGGVIMPVIVGPPGYLGLAGEPIRGPIERTLLVGPSVLPGLGQEGRLLAAWAAARLVTRSDRRKARMRREMWTKIEIS